MECFLTAVIYQEEIGEELCTLILCFYGSYTISITNICCAGWPSTFGLEWHCSISCFTHSSYCFSVRFNGNHETTSGEHVGHPSLSIFFNKAYLIYFFWQTNDPSQKNTLLIFKFLPLMIGYFSLSVPSGLTIYWLVYYKIYQRTPF